jgi:pantoate--beta-alanine ligase
MLTFDRITPLRQYVNSQKAAGRAVSFVPTMGALHEGHQACLEIAGREGDVTISSIYINPTQFGPGEDFGRYPRVPEKDLEICERCGCEALFMPADEEMYSEPQQSWVTVDQLVEPLCGRMRPGHFRGVTTVVAKLFNIVNPDVAVFGQKDAQQALLIRTMTRQLGFPVRIVLAPIVRESDGLAVSSRNQYLSAPGRQLAAGLNRSLQAGWKLIEAGERDPDVVIRAVWGKLARSGITAVEYVELLRAADLSPVRRIEAKFILALAAKIESTRLIDNIVLQIDTGGRVEETILF